MGTAQQEFVDVDGAFDVATCYGLVLLASAELVGSLGFTRTLHAYMIVGPRYDVIGL